MQTLTFRPKQAYFCSKFHERYKVNPECQILSRVHDAKDLKSHVILDHTNIEHNLLAASKLYNTINDNLKILEQI